MKVERDTFLYLDPSGEELDNFAQCGTCRFASEDGDCAILGIPIDDDDSCGFYVPGAYDGAEVRKSVTPEDAGFVDRQVRCEHCKFFDPIESDCELFELLNAKHPTVFDLDAKVKAHGCCNAQTPKGVGTVGESFERYA